MAPQDTAGALAARRVGFDAGKLALPGSGPYLGPVRTRPPDACRRLSAFERRVRAVVLRWVAAVAAIDEAREAARLDEEELEALDEAIDRARKAGR
jgi:hypothetical protein